MPIREELDQGRAETSPTLPLVIHTVKASISESLNYKILEYCWEIYAIYLQAFKSLTTLRWRFHAMASWYNRLFLAKGTSLVPSFHRFLSALTHAAPPVHFCCVWCSPSCEPFYSLNQWRIFLPGQGRGAEGVSKIEEGVKKGREKISLCQWVFTFIMNWKSSH